MLNSIYLYQNVIITSIAILKKPIHVQMQHAGAAIRPNVNLQKVVFSENAKVII